MGDEIDICIDGHHEAELAETAHAIIAAGGITATGELVIARETLAGRLECLHRLEAESAEPWTPQYLD